MVAINRLVTLGLVLLVGAWCSQEAFGGKPKPKPQSKQSNPPPSVVFLDAPQVCMTGVLKWKEHPDGRCTIERIRNGTEMLISTSWKESSYAVARSFSPGGSGFAPSRKIGETERDGPSFLVTGVDTSGFTEGMEWKPEGIFIVESSREISGKTVLVLNHSIEEELHQQAEADSKAAYARRAVEIKAQAARIQAEEAAKWRTWTDATGKHKIEAKFGAVIAGKVKLIKRDGSTVQIPLENLSDDDQDWINNRRR